MKIKEPEFESYLFYDGAVELKYDPKKHVYLLVKGEKLIPQDGVTTICKIIDKSNILINWAVKVTVENLLASVHFPIEEEEFVKAVLKAKTAHRERLEDAGNVGTQAHNWIEGFIKHSITVEKPNVIEFPVSLDERVNNCCWAATKWMLSHNVRWVCTERKVYSQGYEYAGTLDGVAIVDSCDDRNCCPYEYKNRRSLIDWKTSGYIYNEYFFQTAAYQFAYEEETGDTIDDRWIIRLGKDDGAFEAWHLEGETFGEDFMTFLSCLELTRQVRSVTNRVNQRKNDLKAEKKIRVKMAKEKNNAKDGTEEHYT
jgi:hypothetical protein